MDWAPDWMKKDREEERRKREERKKEAEKSRNFLYPKEQELIEDLLVEVVKGKRTVGSAHTVIKDRIPNADLGVQVYNSMSKNIKSELQDKREQREKIKKNPKLKFADEWIRHFETKVKLGEIGEKNALEELKNMGIEGKKIEASMRKAQEKYLEPMAKKLKEELKNKNKNFKELKIRQDAIQSTLNLYASGELTKETAEEVLFKLCKRKEEKEERNALLKKMKKITPLKRVH